MFGYGCAVFMQSDIVDFQRQGWKPEEIMAGLCNVLPKNIWLYVSQIPEPCRARHDASCCRAARSTTWRRSRRRWISSSRASRARAASPTSSSTSTAAKSGAIGAALEAERLWENGPQDHASSASTPCQQITYDTTRNEDTRCYFCKNKCLRTFIDVKTAARSIEVG